jgi:Predicted secreted protein containing a PDZ domain
MNLTYIILLLFLITYIPFYFYVRTGKLEKYGIVHWGPAVMFRTKLGLRIMDRLAKYRRFWRFFGIVSRILTVILMAFIVFIVVIDLIMLPSMMGGPNIGIEYALAIPGLNPMLPLVYGLIGLIVAMVVHELAHGIQSRANDIDVKSSGLLYVVVPMGAFVEPDEEGIKKANRGARMDMFSAGIATNVTLAAVLFIVMSAGMLGSLSTDYGESPAVMAISGNSPAIDADIPISAIMLDWPTENEFDLDPASPMPLRYLTKDGERIATGFRMGVYIADVVSGSPADGMKGNFLYKFNGDIVKNLDFLSERLNATSPGDIVTITLLSTDGVETDRIITLAKHPDDPSKGYMGIYMNYSGMRFVAPNDVLALAKNPFAFSESISDIGYDAISYIGSPFRGYSPLPETVQWWFDASNGFWIAVTAIYWIFWLNLVLAIFNALPARAFDGGALFAGGIDWITEKFVKEEERRDRIVNSVSSVVSTMMLCAFALIVIVILI